MSNLSKNLAKIEAKQKRDEARKERMKTKGKKITWGKKAYKKYYTESKKLSDYTCPKHGIIE